MFYIKIGDYKGNNEFIYYPADTELSMYGSSLSMKMGEAGQFTFYIPYSNINYALIQEQKIITVYKNDAEFWRGYIKEISTDFNKTLEVYCIEDLGWLGYEYQPPARVRKTRTQALSDVLAYYNSLAGINGTEKAFEVGIVTRDYEKTIATSYEDSLLDTLRIIAGDDYVRVRRANGKRYIDIVTLDAFGLEIGQQIVFGDNLMSYVRELNTSYMLNVIYPYGKEMESELYEGVSERLAGEPISNQTSIQKYGRISKNIFFDTSDAEELQEQAEAYLQRNASPRVSFELTAVDLAELGIVSDGFELGNKVKIIAEQIDIDGVLLPITEMTIDLQNPASNKITLSSTVSSHTLTSQTSEITAEIQSLPSKASILDSAKRNALNILEGTTGGYVSFETDEDGNLTALCISNAPKKSEATQRWKWNLGGLGFEHRDNPEDDWEINNAMTMDGSIVAERIGAGTITGCELISNTNGDYVDIKEGDIYGGDVDGEHGYLTFSSKSGTNKTITLSNTTGGTIRLTNGTSSIEVNPSSIALVTTDMKMNGNYGWNGRFYCVKSVIGSDIKYITITVVNGIITSVNDVS